VVRRPNSQNLVRRQSAVSRSIRVQRNLVGGYQPRSHRNVIGRCMVGGAATHHALSRVDKLV
jgi:hypothetical protein